MQRHLQDLHLITTTSPDRFTTAPKMMIAGSCDSETNASAVLSPTTTTTPLQYQHQSQYASASTSSFSSTDYTPVSPTFSLRQSGRFSSASSSLASSPNLRSSLDGINRMPLLTEEQEEREKQSSRQETLCDRVSAIVEDITNKHHLDTTAFPDYDWCYTPPYEGSDYEFSVKKRHCADGSPDGGMSSRITQRFPSIARKFKSKRETRTPSLTGSMHEAYSSRSRASSLRSPSVFEKATEIPPTPPMPQESLIGVEAAMEVEEEEEEDDDLTEEVQVALARTPLLPPVLALKMDAEIPMQSPLQSPSIDATPSLPQSPYESPNPFVHLPSPPLSTKPSMASFRHRAILPSGEIPIINLADSQDEWSFRLGHANFTIFPEPYLPSGSITLSACQRLKADWERAQANFLIHKERTKQVYGQDTKVYHLTEVKWADLNLQWKQYYEQAMEAVPRISQETLQASFHSQDTTTLAPVSSTETLPTSPIIANLPKEGKFPTPGAGGIVGPMEKIQPRTRKRSFWKFFQGVWPTAVWGTSQA